MLAKKVHVEALEFSAVFHIYSTIFLLMADVRVWVDSPHEPRIAITNTVCSACVCFLKTESDSDYKLESFGRK